MFLLLLFFFFYGQYDAKVVFVLGQVNNEEVNLPHSLSQKTARRLLDTRSDFAGMESAASLHSI